MGRCPEDGQTVVFEASADQALDLFCDLQTAPSICRLAALHQTVYAIYTPLIGCELEQIAADASRIFDYAIYGLVCDFPVLQVWKGGSIFIKEIPGGHFNRSFRKQFGSTIFSQSNTSANERLWDEIHDFIWTGFADIEFLLQR